MTILTANVAVERAAAMAGSDDFGPDGWQEGLDRTLDAYARLPLTGETRALLEAKIVGDLVTRTRIEAWYKAHPGAEDAVIEGPVLVCGMPRTGTTATVGLMALDPRFRFLRAWEALAPVPPPVAGEEDADPRVLAARARAKDYEKPHMHIHDPDGPEEDISLLSPLNFRGYNGHLPMPADYIAWWASVDFANTYAYHRRILTMLQARRGPTLWLLKAPPHLVKLESFARAFPNARYVMTHRDPAKVISSVASLQSTMQEQRCTPGAIDRAERGRHYLDFWSEGMRSGLAARARIGEERFIDVHNDEVVRDPLAVFDRVYAHLGMPMPRDFPEKVAQYQARNARGSGGEHRHAPEDFGLTRDGIRDRFRDYTERFGT